MSTTFGFFSFVTKVLACEPGKERVVISIFVLEVLDIFLPAYSG